MGTDQLIPALAEEEEPARRSRWRDVPRRDVVPLLVAVLGLLLFVALLGFAALKLLVLPLSDLVSSAEKPEDPAALAQSFVRAARSDQCDTVSGYLHGMDTKACHDVTLSAQAAHMTQAQADSCTDADVVDQIDEGTKADVRCTELPGWVVHVIFVDSRPWVSGVTTP